MFLCGKYFKMTLQEFKNKLQNNPRGIQFTDTISVIESNYDFTPSAFENGKLKNKKSENQGSCKVFSFAVDQKLNKEETLACFGQYYFNDVLENLEGEGHQNIRNFIKTSFKGLVFEIKPLKRKV